MASVIVDVGDGKGPKTFTQEFVVVALNDEGRIMVTGTCSHMFTMAAASCLADSAEAQMLNTAKQMGLIDPDKQDFKKHKETVGKVFDMSQHKK